MKTIAIINSRVIGEPVTYRATINQCDDAAPATLIHAHQATDELSRKPLSTWERIVKLQRAGRYARRKQKM